MREFNAVNFIDSMDTNFRREVDAKIKDINEKWKEVQTAVQNLAVDAGETFRMRGETARRLDEAIHWKEKYKRECVEKEKLQEELVKTTSELEKFKTDKRKVNESIMTRNATLVKKLVSEIEGKLELMDEVLADDSQYNQLSKTMQIEWLKKLRAKSERELTRFEHMPRLRRSMTLTEQQTFV